MGLLGIHDRKCFPVFRCVEHAIRRRPGKDPTLASIDRFRGAVMHDFDKQSAVAIIVLRTVVYLKNIKNE